MIGVLSNTDTFAADTILASQWGHFLWGNAITVTYGIAFCIYLKHPVMIPEITFMALCTPPALRLLGPSWTIVAILDVAYFLFRTTAAICVDAIRRTEKLSKLSVIETVNVIPVGILATERRSASALMNNTMRDTLGILDLPTDLGDLSDMWERLDRVVEPFRAIANLQGVPLLSGEGNVKLLIRLPNDTYKLFTREISENGERQMTLALDVTDLALANRNLWRANLDLKDATEAIREQMSLVSLVAEGEAHLKMRARVHDVVGQRLSIIHRYLEEQRIDDASVAELKELIATVMNDLRGDAGDASTALAAVVSAFALVGVEIEVTGELPTNPRVAAALVDVIRETATNACKHGHAHTVEIQLGRKEASHGARYVTLVAHDDGDGMAKNADITSGIVAAKRIKRDSPKTRVVIMTGMPDITFVEQARDAGVDSFVYKNVGISELLSVMRSTDSGYSTFPKAPDSVFSGSAALTDEEIQILRLVCEAKSRKEIASELYMSEGTVKRRIGEILAKTGYDNILRLAVHAVAEGSIVPRIGDK